ncbi:MAG: hypothetical protein RMJ86_08910 [Anaerolineae bacterium]|nr:hypothetical protein [Anaerolineae bacterium]
MVEALWQTEFWRRAVLSGDFNLVSFSAMWPIGTHMFSIAHNGVGLLLLVFSLPFGSIAAVNLGFIASFILSFLGAKQLLHRFTSSPFLASVGATLATFAFGKTVAIRGHLHVSLGAAFCVWTMLVALLLVQTSDANRRAMYALLAGILWGISIILHPYFLFLSALMMLLPLLHGKGFFKYALFSAATAALLSFPYLAMFYQGREHMSSLPPNLAAFSAYPSSIVLLGWKAHALPQLRSLTMELLGSVLARGEPGFYDWGILVWVFTLLALTAAQKYPLPAKLPILSILVVALILSLGPVWVDPPLLPPLVASINGALWKLGSELKPSLFDHWSADLAGRVLPLPAFPLYLFVPYFEMVRVPGRFLIIVGLCAVVLSVAFLSKLPRPWQFFLGTIWLLELLPAPVSAHLAPTQPHPAHLWASHNLALSEGVYTTSGPRWVYSSYLAGIKSTSTIGSFVPSHTLYTAPLIPFSHSPYRLDDAVLANPDLVNILVRAQVRLVLLIPEEGRAAARNPHLRFLQCFPAPSEQFLYLSKTTLCAFEVTKSPAEVHINIQPRRGFSGFEVGLDKPDRLIWVIGKEAEAGWHLHSPDDHTIDVALRAFCPPNTSQTAEIFVNMHRVTRLHWSDNCWEPQSATIYLPRALLRQGWNAVVIKAASAARPIEHLKDSTDRRLLSVAVERLHLRPVRDR